MTRHAFCKGCGEKVELSDLADVRLAHCPQCNSRLSEVPVEEPTDPIERRDQRDMLTARAALAISILAVAGSVLIVWALALGIAAIVLAFLAAYRRGDDDMTMVIPLAMSAGILAAFAIIFAAVHMWR